MLQLPPEVTGRAESLGEAGRIWLDDLEDIVRNLEAQWDITIGTPLSGGSHSLVALADGRDGGQYAVKVDVPENPDPVDFLKEVRTLEIANGRGYAKLFAYDVENRACLLERLGPTLQSMGLPVQEQIQAICDTLKATWEIPVKDHGCLSDGAESVAWFRKFLVDSWENLKRPCPKRVIDCGLMCLRSREEALDRTPCVLVHGDAHANNTLAAPGGGFRLIDPDGLYYEKAYDLGVLVREWMDTYLADPVGLVQKRCQFMHELTNVPQRDIWEWGYTQTVSTGLVLVQVGQQDYGKSMLELAGTWAAHWDRLQVGMSADSGSFLPQKTVDALGHPQFLKGT